MLFRSVCMTFVILGHGTLCHIFQVSECLLNLRNKSIKAEITTGSAIPEQIVRGSFGQQYDAFYVPNTTELDCQ